MTRSMHNHTKQQIIISITHKIKRVKETKCRLYKRRKRVISLAQHVLGSSDGSEQGAQWSCLYNVPIGGYSTNPTYLQSLQPNRQIHHMEQDRRRRGSFLSSRHPLTLIFCSFGRFPLKMLFNFGSSNRHRHRSFRSEASSEFTSLPNTYSNLPQNLIFRLSK